MDPLSAGACIITFLSLPIQLAESVQKLHDFWASIEAAPEDIQNIVEDLKLLESILRQIDQEKQRLSSTPLQHQLFLNVLRRCKWNIKKLDSMMNGIHTACAEDNLRKKLATFKFIFKRPQIERLQDLLERTKTSLILELLQLNEYSPSSCAVFSLDLLTNQRFRNAHYFSVTAQQIANLVPMRADMIAVNQQSETEHVACSSQPNETYSLESMNTKECARMEMEHAILPMRMVRRNSQGRLSYRRKFSKHFNTLLGTILVSQVHSSQGIETPKRAYDHQGRECHKWVVKIVPMGISRCVFKSAVDFSISWKTSKATPCGFTSIQQSLRYYPVVPETAEIFEACRLGNIPWVQSLLDRNVASPFDTDPNGWTPLHVAAYAHRTELCRLLIDHEAETNALTSFESHPLALACMGDRFEHKPLLELVRVLIEHGGSDPTIQDSIGDDCLYHMRRSNTIPRYLRLQSSVPCGSNDPENDPVSALHWAVVECASPEMIEKILEKGANPNKWNYGFRSETGPILHCSASLLTPVQTTPNGLPPADRDCRIKKIINLVLNFGSDLYALDDNLVTALDIVLEICRKWRYRKGLSIWRAAIEDFGIDWEEYLAKEISLHSERSRIDYGGARDYYWSLEMQKDYWLSHEWEEEAQERLFWNPARLDFDPLKNSGGTYAPSLRSCQAKWRSKGIGQCRH